ncbi:MAG: transcriptional repressor LexA [Gammaproteobacteria bacterium]
MDPSLTARQREVLAAIREALDRTGSPPTRAELARRLGVKSANAAEIHLRALARKGAIRLLPGASRGIQVLVDDDTPAGLPVVGRVAAGAPVLAAPHIEDWHRVDPALFHPQPDYLLRVHGASMRDAGILDGDLLAVHATPEARDGQIIVARIADEVTVKRYRRRGTTVTLVAENPDFAPIEVDLRLQDFAIEGLGVGILRHRGL